MREREGGGTQTEEDLVDDFHQRLDNDKLEIDATGVEKVLDMDGSLNMEEEKTIYNKESYNRVMSHTTNTECSSCENEIRKGKVLFECRNCMNGHVICEDCMRGQNMDGLAPSECTHGDYEDSQSYEMCISPSYSWMNKNKPEKKCSTCGESSKPTGKNPYYYCKHCWLHRMCKRCWNKEQLKTAGDNGATAEGTERVRPRRTRNTKQNSK
jgi:predicted RNA-binding Zn-ribbon protein involved in translation (DUF1610 family)